jgi:hypothetical protein
MLKKIVNMKKIMRRLLNLNNSKLYRLSNSSIDRILLFAPILFMYAILLIVEGERFGFPDWLSGLLYLIALISFPAGGIWVIRGWMRFFKKSQDNEEP